MFGMGLLGCLATQDIIATLNGSVPLPFNWVLKLIILCVVLAISGIMCMTKFAHSK